MGLGELCVKDSNSNIEIYWDLGLRKPQTGFHFFALPIRDGPSDSFRGMWTLTHDDRLITV